MMIDIDVNVEIDAEMVRQAVTKTILDYIGPANYGANYLEKQHEIKAILASIDFTNVAQEIEDRAEISKY
jgi:hypothetical protein